MRTIIQGVETANPSLCLTQQEVLRVVSDTIKPSGRVLDLYKRFLSDEGIHQRYFASDNLQQLLNESVDDKMQRFEHWAVSLSVEAVKKLLAKQQILIANHHHGYFA